MSIETCEQMLETAATDAAISESEAALKKDGQLREADAV